MQERNAYSPHRRVGAPEGGGSGRNDGIARPSQGSLNKSRSEDRATGHDNEVVVGHQKTSEEALGASESATAAAT